MKTTKKHKHDNLLFKRTVLEFMVELGYLKENSAVAMRYTVKFNKPFSEMGCNFCQSLFDNDIIKFQELSKRFNEIYNNLKHSQKIIERKN